MDLHLGEDLARGTRLRPASGWTCRTPWCRPRPRQWPRRGGGSGRSPRPGLVQAPTERQQVAPALWSLSFASPSNPSNLMNRAMVPPPLKRLLRFRGSQDPLTPPDLWRFNALCNGSTDVTYRPNMIQTFWRSVNGKNFGAYIFRAGRHTLPPRIEKLERLQLGLGWMGSNIQKRGRHVKQKKLLNVTIQLRVVAEGKGILRPCSRNARGEFRRRAVGGDYGGREWTWGKSRE